MALLRLEVATLSAEKTVANAKAAPVVRAFARATGAPDTATDQELIAHALRELVEYMVSVARQKTLADAAEAARSNADALNF